MRENGLSRPWSLLQVVTWITLPVLMVQFLLFVTPMLPLAASIALTSAYVLICVTSATYAYMACVIDPMDSLLAGALNKKTNDNNKTKASWLPLPKLASHHTDDTTDEEITKQCWVCDVQVHDHAMHCKYCDKCVAHFDHHCQWLNTCIGQANYKHFYVTLWCLTFMLLFQFGSVLGVAIAIFVDDNGDAKRRAQDSWIGSSTAVAVTNVVFGFFILVMWSLVVQLLVFHLGLIKNGLTTYQFIVQENAKKRELEKQELTRKQKRILAISRAKAQGETVLAWRLAMGQWKVCSWCDPLPRGNTSTSSSSVQRNSTTGLSASNHAENGSVESANDEEIGVAATAAMNGGMNGNSDMNNTSGDAGMNGSMRQDGEDDEEEESKQPES